MIFQVSVSIGGTPQIMIVSVLAEKIGNSACISARKREKARESASCYECVQLWEAGVKKSKNRKIENFKFSRFTNMLPI